jgi:DNA adenine methylase
MTENPTNSAASRRVKPFLRWAGSKRKQLDRLIPFWSNNYTGYVEPFAGSACLFFALAPKNAVLGDSNAELIEVYKVVRDEPDRLYRRLKRIRRDSDSYQRWRSMNPRCLDSETRALRFLFLNRNCFNGIYRTNLEGKFNVPIGSKLSTYFAKEELLQCSALLQKTTLVAGDFTKTINRVKPGNFVYLDPPYAVNSRRIFREYGRQIFSSSDMDRFSSELHEITEAKADFLVSYADCSEARTLARRWNAIRVPVRRNIAGFANARRNAYEWIITNLSGKKLKQVASWQS